MVPCVTVFWGEVVVVDEVVVVVAVEVVVSVDEWGGIDSSEKRNWYFILSCAISFILSAAMKVVNCCFCSLCYYI